MRQRVNRLLMLGKRGLTGPIFQRVGSHLWAHAGRVGTGAWSPAALFAAGEAGAWYDPSDLSTLFRDLGATLPVTTVGLPVRLMLDKSGNGHHLTTISSASRPLLQQDENGKYYLDFDGIDDFLKSTTDPVACGTCVAGLYIDWGSVPFAGYITSATEQSSDVNIIFLRDNATSTFYINQLPGTNLQDSSHNWINGALSATPAQQTPLVCSADGTGHPGQLRFPNGVCLGRDRIDTARYGKGRNYGVVLHQDILSTEVRNQVESWMANKTGVTL